MKKSEIDKCRAWENLVIKTTGELLDLTGEEMSDKLIIMMEEFIGQVWIEKAKLEKKHEETRKKFNIIQGEKK